MPDQILEYPEDCIQSLIDPWWTTATDSEVRRGQLLWAFVPHVDLEPMTLHPEERSAPTDHQRVRYRLEPLRSSQKLPSPPLPVAAMPAHPGEIRTVYRSKLRPVVVVSLGGREVGKALRLGAARWQSNPTFLVAPYYGAERSDMRGGWKPELVRRIRHAEYPQYLWDLLPVGESHGSILRLDHLQPIGRHHNAYVFTPHRLSEDALEVLDGWLDWLVSDRAEEGSWLQFIREELRTDS